MDESTGRMTGGFTTYAICGAIRRYVLVYFFAQDFSLIKFILLPKIFTIVLFCRMGESDDCINRLAKKDGIIDKKF